jgi:hypothetical protein
MVIPVPIAIERRPVLQRALRDLPSDILVALRSGIDKNDGRLRPGGLFSATGDCPVGVLLRELEPGRRTLRGRFGLLRVCHRSIAQEAPELRAALPRIAHLEICFDVTVRRCVEDHPEPGAHAWAQAVGRWFAACVTAELDGRERPVQTLVKKSSPSESSRFVAAEFRRVTSSV